MKAIIRKWGSSLGLYIPKPLVQQMGVGENSVVEIILKGTTLVLEPVRSSRRTQSQRKPIDWYLEQMTPENIPEPADDEPVGSEVV